MSMITVLTSDEINHGPIAVVDSAPNFAAYSSSIATQNALKAACDAGNWQPYTSPTMIAEPLPPDWKTFRLALLKSKSFRLWSELLPSSWREDLKMAAMVGNAEALQSIYDYCKSISIPGFASTAEWQKLADTSHIPVTF